MHLGPVRVRRSKYSLLLLTLTWYMIYLLNIYKREDIYHLAGLDKVEGITMQRSKDLIWNQRLRKIKSECYGSCRDWKCIRYLTLNIVRQRMHNLVHGLNIPLQSLNKFGQLANFTTLNIIYIWYFSIPIYIYIYKQVNGYYYDTKHITLNVTENCNVKYLVLSNDLPVMSA